MIERFDIAGYARISVDDEQDQKNISIENQKAIIEDYVKTHFPGSTLTFFEAVSYTHLTLPTTPYV
mgnify:CR=1 FL=1